jgi:hypothetical protein
LKRIGGNSDLMEDSPIEEAITHHLHMKISKLFSIIKIYSDFSFLEAKTSVWVFRILFGKLI